jgi:Ca-activated chloride channel family protein
MHSNDKAKQIGAGHRVTAFYKIRPASFAASGEQQDDSRIRPSEFVTKSIVDAPKQLRTCLTVNLRYKRPSESESIEFQVRVPASEPTAVPSGEFQFASAVAGYGLLLRDSQYSGQASWDWVIQTADLNRGSDPRGLRSEFIELVKLARRLDP